MLQNQGLLLLNQSVIFHTENNLFKISKNNSMYQLLLQNQSDVYFYKIKVTIPPVF